MDQRQLGQAYTEAIGRPATTVARLPGGAGNRIYWRVGDATGASAVVMELPPEPGKSEEVSKDGVPQDLPFLNVHRYLQRLGVRVPRIHLDAHRRGFVVLEDLTDRTLELALSDGDRHDLYARAIDRLARLRAHAERDPDPSCVAFGRAFDFDLYQWEFEREGGPRLDERQFVAFFDLLTVQRKLKDAGRFVFIDQVKKNPSFLPHIPSSLRYVKGALARQPALANVREILARHVPELR